MDGAEEYDPEWIRSFVGIATCAVDHGHNRFRVVVVTKNVHKAKLFLDSIFKKPFGNVIAIRSFSTISVAFKYLIQESDLMLVGPSSFAVAAAYLARKQNFQAILSNKTWERFQQYRFCFFMGRESTKRCCSMTIRDE